MTQHGAPWPWVAEYRQSCYKYNPTVVFRLAWVELSWIAALHNVRIQTAGTLFLRLWWTHVGYDVSYVGNSWILQAHYELPEWTHAQKTTSIVIPLQSVSNMDRTIVRYMDQTHVDTFDVVCWTIWRQHGRWNTSLVYLLRWWSQPVLNANVGGPLKPNPNSTDTYIRATTLVQKVHKSPVKMV